MVSHCRANLVVRQFIIFPPFNFNFHNRASVIHFENTQHTTMKLHRIAYRQSTHILNKIIYLPDAHAANVNYDSKLAFDIIKRLINFNGN